MGLEIAIVGYNRSCALHTLRKIVQNENSRVVSLQLGNGRAIMDDGTRYQVMSESSLKRLDGIRIDQLIVTEVSWKQMELFYFIREIIRINSCVPEEFWVQTYEY